MLHLFQFVYSLLYFAMSQNIILFLRIILPYPHYFWDMVPASRQPAIPGYQNITFDGSIIKLCNSNITVTVLLLHLLVPLFFLTFNGFILTLCSSNITCNNFVVTFGDSFFFLLLLTFDNFILTLCSSNITCDCSFVTFDGLLIFFSYI